MNNNHLKGTPSGSLGHTASRAASMAACPCSESSSTRSRSPCSSSRQYTRLIVPTFQCHTLHWGEKAATAIKDLTRQYTFYERLKSLLSCIMLLQQQEDWTCPFSNSPIEKLSNEQLLKGPFSAQYRSLHFYDPQLK